MMFFIWTQLQKDSLEDLAWVGAAYQRSR